MATLVKAIGAKAQRKQNYALQNDSAFCTAHNSRLAPRAGKFAHNFWSFHLIRDQLR